MRKPVSKRVRAIFVFTILFADTVCAEELPRVRPEQVGFSKTRLEYIDQFYAERVEKGELAGIVVLIARHGRVAHFSAIGYANVETKQKLTPDSLFRLYSMTKPIASAALMILYQEGRFQMGDAVSKYLPEFSSLRALRNRDAALYDTVPLERRPTIQDLLRHTAGFSHGFMKSAVDSAYAEKNVFDLDISLAESMGRLASVPLLEQPGEKLIYSVGTDVVARLVEVISGMPLEDFLDQRLFKPLGMKDTGYVVPADQAQRVASVHWTKNGRLVPLDEQHGHPDGPGTSRGWAAVNIFTTDHELKGGSSGLLGTAADYWRFAQMILNNGELDGTRILSPQIVRYMMRDQLGSLELPGVDDRLSGTGFGLGFAVTRDPAKAGYIGSEGSIQWAGAAATYFWIDPKQDMVVVMMGQHMSVPGIESLAAEIRTLVYSALLE